MHSRLTALRLSTLGCSGIRKRTYNGLVKELSMVRSEAGEQCIETIFANLIKSHFHFRCDWLDCDQRPRRCRSILTIDFND